MLPINYEYGRHKNNAQDDDRHKSRTQLKITIIQVQSFKVQECGSNGGQERGAYQVSDSCGGGDKLVDNDDDVLDWVTKKMFCLPLSNHSVLRDLAIGSYNSCGNYIDARSNTRSI